MCVYNSVGDGMTMCVFSQEMRIEIYGIMGGLEYNLQRFNQLL